VEAGPEKNRRNDCRVNLLQSSQRAAAALLCVLSVPAFGDAFSRLAQASAWTAGPGAPEAQAAAAGVWFACPFDGGADRFYWDARATLELGEASGIDFELTAKRPTASRSLSIYFKSGEGWYHWSRTVRGEARQTLSIVKSECSVEGLTAGWNKIEMIRFSPWSGSPHAAGFVLHNVSPRTDSIVLVEATSSSPNAAERAVARRATRQISAFLNDAGIKHGSLDDDAVAAGALRHASVAILGYNPTPPPGEIAALNRFSKRGGKLIVCRSASESLARLMGLRLGTIVTSDRPGQWHAMRFDAGSAPGMPSRVYDVAWSLIPAYPAEDHARVAATWEDAAGRLSNEAAVLRTAKGYWICHVLRGEGPHAKGQMLMHMMAESVPTVYREAARHYLATAGIMEPFSTLPDTLQHIMKQAPRDKRREVQSLVDSARGIRRSAAASFASGRHVEALELADRLERVVQNAYGSVQSSRAKELRGIWDHDGVGLYPGDWNRTCSELSQYGLNAVFPNLAWGGKAHFPSKNLPGSKTLEQYGDQLGQCLMAAKRAGLEVHVWKVCWNIENAPADFRAKMRREGRLQESAGGMTKEWLTPSHPKNVALELAVIREMAERYPIDGVHLDYVRYPSSEYCFSPVTRKAFESDLGYPVPNWPHGVQRTGTLRTRFETWRADRITDFVEQARAVLREARPAARLSAAVYRRYPSCRESVGQDWGEWVARGIVDFVCPMNYTEDRANFVQETKEQLALRGASRRVFPGIGVASNDSRLDPDQVIVQIQAARELGAGGFVLFDLGPTVRDEVLPILARGTTEKP
jgi:uncharacterized lipoprotein YddW (UPF0748 family)